MLKLNKQFLFSFYFVYFFLDFITVRISDINLKIYQIFAPIIIVYVLLNLQKITQFKMFEIIFFLFYLYLAITTLWSIDIILSLRLVFLEIILIFVYLYSRIEINKFSIIDFENIILKLGKLYIIGSIIMYFIGIYMYIPQDMEQNTCFGLFQENILPRLRGFAESPNTFIGFSLFFLSFFLKSKKILWVFLAWLSILMSFSTTGIIISIFIFIIFIENIKSFKTLMSLLVIVLIIFIIYLYIQSKTNINIHEMIDWRLERNLTGSGRFELWDYTLDLINNNVFGYGINTTRIVIHDFYSLNSTHNSIIEVFLTGGFIGLFLYLLLYLTLFLQAIYIWFRKKEKIGLAMFIIFVLTGFANNTLHIVYNIIYLLSFYIYSKK